MGFKLLTEPPAEARITGVILQAIMPGWWIIKDDTGRKYRVSSLDLWRKGERVAVVGGEIIGHAGVAETPAVHQV